MLPRMMLKAPIAVLALFLMLLGTSHFVNAAVSISPLIENDTAREALPVLADGYVNPWYSVPDDTYTFSIVYKNTAGAAPEYLRAIVNGTAINLDPVPGIPLDYVKGVPFIVKTHFPVGNYSFHFEAKNSEGTARFPETTERPFRVSYLDAYLANATVTPLVGSPTDIYTFTITYVGPHRPWGTGVRLHVFPYRTPLASADDYNKYPLPIIWDRIPQTDSTESNYSAGVEFRKSLALEAGTWWNYYACNSSFHYPFFRHSLDSLERGRFEEFFPGPWVLANDSQQQNGGSKTQNIAGLALPMLIFALGLAVRRRGISKMPGLAKVQNDE
ncbi:MAG: hypothetical protein ACFFGZ_07660 [Candidatus Thorarchaeota archaeon]